MTIPIFENIALHSLIDGDAVDVYNTIVSQREYLGEWLPFVALTNSIDFTQPFVDSAVNAPTESFEHIFTIRKEKELVGLIGLKSTDRANHKTEIGYWLSQHHQGKIVCDHQHHAFG